MTGSDADLIARSLQGERHAFEALVRRHLPTAFAVARSLTDDVADAEDVCQEAFVTVLKRLEDCREPERFVAWLLEIVRNRARSLQRARAVRATLPLESAPPAADDRNPLEEAARGELRERLASALQDLTEAQRQVLLLHDLEGWPHREIGQRLGISEVTARVHLHNARKALRTRLPASCMEEGFA